MYIAFAPQGIGITTVLFCFSAGTLGSVHIYLTQHPHYVKAVRVYQYEIARRTPIGVDGVVVVHVATRVHKHRVVGVVEVGRPAPAVLRIAAYSPYLSL